MQTDGKHHRRIIIKRIRSRVSGSAPPVQLTAGQSLCDKFVAMAHLPFNHSVPKRLGIFPCGVCGKIFTEAVRLRIHEAQHPASGGVHGGGIGSGSGGDSSVDAPGDRTPAPRVPTVPPGNGTVTRRLVCCDICGKVFRGSCDLNRHKLSHSDERPFPCPVCGMRFKRKDRLSYHVRAHDGKPFVCPSCGKSFSRPDHLSGHIKQVHTSERPHKCQICNASFATRDRLRSHLACHEDKIPCQVCGKFLRAAYMTDHLKKHSEGPHNYCGICNKDGLEDPEKCPHQDSESSDASFGDLSDGGDLKAQQKAGEDDIGVFACGGGPSAGAGKLKADPEKKHSCSACGQAFRSKSYLNKHVQRVHSGARKGLSGTGTGLGEQAPSLGSPSLGSPFSPQQNMSLLESFGFQIVQSAFASSLADSEAGHSSVGMGSK